MDWRWIKYIKRLVGKYWIYNLKLKINRLDFNLIKNIKSFININKM